MARRRRGPTAAFSLFSFQDIITSVTGIVLLVTLLLSLELVNRVPGEPAAAVSPAATNTELAELQQEAKRLQAELAAGQEELTAFAESTPAEVQRRRTAVEAEARALETEVRDLGQQQTALAGERTTLERASAASAEQQQTLEQTAAERQQAADELAGLKSRNAVLFNPDQAPGRTVWLVDVAADSVGIRRFQAGAERTEFRGRWLNSAASQALAQMRSWRPGSDQPVLLVRPSGIKSFEEIAAALRGRGFDLGFDVLEEEQSVDLAVPTEPAP
ncbi:MAG: hypothetical protein U0836_21340 [Pirellulales bacterium]